MSTLDFVQSRQHGSGMFEARNCGSYTCNKAGRWRVRMMGRDVDMVLCTQCANRWRRDWDRAAGRDEVAAA